jgi:nitrogen fixation/metabolism regulation signal transduction histidine kinase
MNNQFEKPDRHAFARKRKLRNYLLDVGMQLRYTAFIIAVAVLLTGVLGYKVYQATQVSSRIVMMTIQADPAAGAELRAQFQANDRIVLYGMAGFGVVLVLSIAAAGIWLTHKVAGPIHNIATTCGHIRDDQLPPVLRQLRRGDELQSFYSQFAEMYAALRTRTVTDIATLDRAIAAIEAQTARSPELELALAELREQRTRKQRSLDPSDG